MSMRPYQSPADTTAHCLVKKLSLYMTSSPRPIRVYGSRIKKRLRTLSQSSVPRVKCRLLPLCYWSVLLTSNALFHLIINRNMFHSRQTWQFHLVPIYLWFAPPPSLSHLSSVPNVNSKCRSHRISNSPSPSTLQMALVPRWTIHPRLNPRRRRRRSNRRASTASNSGVRGQIATSYSRQGRCLSNSY